MRRYTKPKQRAVTESMKLASEKMTRRILVVDDEEAIRIILKASLEMTAGWSVLLAPSADVGIHMATAEQPDVILLDVRMPELDGVSLFHQLQAHARTRDIPIIFLTAEARVAEHKVLEALSAGIILKPFEPTAIAGQIKTLLAWP